MVFCMVALLLPENLWAQTAAVSGTKLTITTTVPGQVSAALVNDVDASSITEIVLKGKFNSSDLEVIKGDAEGNSDGDFTGVTTVDMSEARFERALNPSTVVDNYKWYKTTSTEGKTAGEGTHAVFGGQLWMYSKRQWGNETAGYQANATLYANNEEMQAAKNTSSMWSWAGYPKSYKYSQMQITKSLGGPTATQPGGEIKDMGATWEDTDQNKSTVLSDDTTYPLGTSIRLIYYYKKTHDGDRDPQDQWVRSTKEDYDAVATDNIESTTAYPNMGGVDLNNILHDRGNVGDVMWCYVYYTKVGTRSWINDKDAEEYGATLADFSYDDRNNHMDGFTNGQWVKMPVYTYFQLMNAESGEWVDVTANYDEKSDVRIKVPGTHDALPTEGVNDGDFAIIVGDGAGAGTEYVYTNSSWVSSGASETVADYSQMKFTYWSSTLQTAKTSKYADSNINPDIFQNCNVVTRIEFLGGHVKGLSGKTTALTTLFIGKDVTEIEAAQVQEVTSLTTLTFDKDYTEFPGETPEAKEEAAKAAGYPKQLVISNKAFYGCTYLYKVEIPNRCVSIGNSAFEKVGNQGDTDINNKPKDELQTFTLTFERRNKLDEEEGKTVGISCDFPLTIGESAFMDCWYLRDLSLPIRLERMGNDCFKNTIGMKTLVMREVTKAPYDIPDGHDLLRTIPEGAFYDSAVEEVKIPKCVTEIQKGAFGDTEHLKKLVFQDNDEKRPLTIRTGAFTGGKEEGRPQLDVYVMINPDEGRRVICEYVAFNFTQTVGQTSETRGSAYLHFPEEAWDYYQGDWKRGLAFRQDNLNAMKDGFYGTNNGKECHGKSSGTISDTGIYEDNDGYDNTQYAPANGWQEFARTSTSIDIEIPTGSFMRTYSTSNPMIIPTFTESNATYNIVAGDPMFKIYRISAFDDGYEDGDDVSSATTAGRSRVATATEVVETFGNEPGSRQFIPSNTGLLMVGTVPADYLVYLAEVPVTVNKEYPYRTSEDVNLLYPTCIDNQNLDGSGNAAATAVGQPEIKDFGGISKVVLNPTSPYPYTGSAPDFRYFGFSAAKNQFIRFKEGATATRDKAYLKLAPELFHWSNECADPNVDNHGGSTGVDKPTIPNEQQQGAPIMLSFYDMGGELTDVRTIDFNTFQEIKNDAYYTLQGVKINGRPTQQGIYIHNGKKIVIK